MTTKDYTDRNFLSQNVWHYVLKIENTPDLGTRERERLRKQLLKDLRGQLGDLMTKSRILIATSSWIDDEGIRDFRRRYTELRRQYAK